MESDNTEILDVIGDLVDNDKPTYKNLRDKITCRFRVTKEEVFEDGETTKRPGGRGVQLTLAPIQDDGSNADVTVRERLYLPLRNEAFPEYEPSVKQAEMIHRVCNALWPDEHPNMPKRDKSASGAVYVKQDGSGDTITGEEYPAVKKALLAKAVTRIKGVYDSLLTESGEASLLDETFFATTKKSVRGDKTYINANIWSACAEPQPGVEVEYENFTEETE